MKRILFAVMAFCTVGILSCRKSGVDESIRTFDDNQIKAYIQQNGLTNMTADTSGIYYQVIKQGTGNEVRDSSKISFVYTSKTLDGNYTSTDTILNHTNNYLAYVLPAGIRLGILNILKRTGGKVRLLIPSRLAYGIGGTTIYTFNSDGTNVTSVPHAIAGNQGLDYTVSLVSSQNYVPDAAHPKPSFPYYQAAYDDLSINKYLAANNLAFQQVTTGKYKGLYYKNTNTGTGAAISLNSLVTVQYTGRLLNGNIFDQYTGDTGTSFSLYDVIPGWQGALIGAKAGDKVSLIVPSALAYGDGAKSNTVTGNSIPAFSCLYFDITVLTVTN